MRRFPTEPRKSDYPHWMLLGSVDQLIDKHALLVDVRGWFHRTFECFTPSNVSGGN